MKTENVSKEIGIIKKKEPNGNSEVEKYSNGNENTLDKFSRELAKERIHGFKD